MARLFVLGMELQSVASNVETDGATTGSPEAVSTPVRSGGWALRINPTAQEWLVHNFVVSGGQGNFYFRAYLRITAGPGGAQTRTITFWAATQAGPPILSLRLTPDRNLQIYNDEDAAQVGGNSVALALDTWYRVEVHIDTTTLAATTFEARIDGAATFASGTVNLTGIPAFVHWGTPATDATLDLPWEDGAINNGAGSVENSWPGEGEIIFLRPDADGDNTAWTGGWADVDEAPPDDATTVLSSNTSGQIEDMNLAATPAALATDDVINCVLVGHRFSLSSSAGVDPDFVLRIKASSGGTVEESAAIGPNATSWRTNRNASPRNYALVLYDLPGASTTAWTKADLDAAQIGVRETVTDTHFVQVTAMWLAVDHKPAAAASLDAGPGSYAVTGAAATVPAGRALTGGGVAGAYALAGVAATLAHGFAIYAEPGAVALSGFTAGALAARVLDASPGAIMVSGVAATLAAGKLFDAGPGGYAVTGFGAALAHGFLVPANPGAYLVAGVAAALLAARTLDASPASYLVAGSAAALLAGRAVAADPGTYLISGFEAALIWSGAGATLNAEPGVYQLTGAAATLAAGRIFSADPGIYAAVGADAGLARGFVLDAGSGLYVLAGDPATLLAGRALGAEPGVYVLSGAAAAAVAGRLLAADPGAIVLSGADAGLLAGRVLAALPGGHVLVGFDAGLVLFVGGYEFNAEPGAYVLVGMPAELARFLIAPYEADRRPGGEGHRGKIPEGARRITEARRKPPIS